VFPVRYGLNSYILFRRYPVFKGLSVNEVNIVTNSMNRSLGTPGSAVGRKDRMDGGHKACVRNFGRNTILKSEQLEF
jgi:hypothetical protein